MSTLFVLGSENSHQRVPGSSVFFRGQIVATYSEPEVIRRKNAVTFVFLRVVRSDFQDFFCLYLIR